MPPSKSPTSLEAAGLAGAARFAAAASEGLAALVDTEVAAGDGATAEGGGVKFPRDSCTVGFTSDSFFGWREPASATAGAAGLGAGFAAA